MSGYTTSGRDSTIRGEAYAIRAFMHFDLLRLYGPVYDGFYSTERTICDTC
ncbi:RagB/SusD family nutrient uptake outer membrane protein [Chitinophaga pinensis]|uniref:RagB/SusD family nutrient uptake outer membrane protein n=1 Tax=Chitinophaga pinensis TaxID=79329 RepID=A0A5C6LTB2_9BACT|nr:RagB/SusD family nutrient uptake outer membrane protein [Chitinophaga pinensis]